MVTHTEVRNYLDALPVERVTTVVIETQIRLANAKVDFNKSASADSELVELAKLTLAGCYTYRAYATEYERTSGEVPGPVLTHLDQYCEVAGEFLDMAKSGEWGAASTALGLLTLSRLRTTRMDEEQSNVEDVSPV